jgi:hypothetical protein
MNIAFPIPMGNLASVLRPDAVDLGGGQAALELTTRAPDAGIWLVLRLFGLVRLPMHETIRVFTPDMRFLPRDFDARAVPGATVLARHELWLFGIRYLVLDYWIRAAQT